VKDLHRAYDVYARLLCDEAQKVQQGILREGGIANRALELIAQAQNQRRRFLVFPRRVEKILVEFGFQLILKIHERKIEGSICRRRARRVRQGA
jgi:hypothetical protein